MTAAASAALCAMLLPSPTAAAPATRDGHDLLARCRNEAQPGACFNELILVADMHDVAAAWGVAQAQWCAPADVPPVRLRQIVLTWLEDPAREPKALAAPSTRLIAEAYAAAFPCP